MMRPFCKWAGGKTKLADEILPYLQSIDPKHTYFEPFVGGGAVYYALRSRMGRMLVSSSLGDTNDELITTYECIHRDVESVISKLKEHARVHSEEHYYQVRSHTYSDPAKKAARFLYLNKAGFNGLYRLNSLGGFNVPSGHYETIKFDFENLRECSRQLGNTRFVREDFEEHLKRAKFGDVVYFDPPYIPTSKTANFTAYAASAFNDAEQVRLASCFDRLVNKGVRCVLSNSNTPRAKELYAKHEIIEVRSNGSISAKATSREPRLEILVIGKVLS